LVLIFAGLRVVNNVAQLKSCERNNKFSGLNLTVQNP